MKRPLRFLCLSLLVGALVACSVSPQQVYELRHLLPSAKKREAQRLVAIAWRLQFAGAEYLVWPTSTADGGLIFSGANNLRVVFDGREITRLEGLPGAFGVLQIEKRGNERRFNRGGRRSYTVRCDEPTEWRVDPDRAGWRMQCRGDLNGVPVTTQHTVDRGKANEILRISSTVAPGSQPLTLQAPE